LFEFLEKRKVWLVYTPLVIYWMILFTATSLPAPDLPKIGISDKVAHLTAFFCLAILLNLTLMYQRKSKLFYENASLITLIICLFYAGVDELHQMLIPGRSAELLDWLADGAGAFLGILMVKFLVNRFKYRSIFDDLGKV